jgi:hypothetical protein
MMFIVALKTMYLLCYIQYLEFDQTILMMKILQVQWVKAKKIEEEVC